MTCSTTTGTWFTTSYIGLSLEVPIFEGLCKKCPAQKSRTNFCFNQRSDGKSETEYRSAGGPVAKNNFINAIQNHGRSKNQIWTVLNLFTDR